VPILTLPILPGVQQPGRPAARDSNAHVTHDETLGWPQRPLRAWRVLGPDRLSRSAARPLFFGKARRVQCHAVAGTSNESTLR